MRPFAIVFCALLFIDAAFAQSDRGAITGTVSDQTKALVPGAAVVGVNTETGARYPTVTTPTGNYTLPELPVGVYSVTVTASGFSTFVQQGIKVSVAQTLRIDIPLKLGSASTQSVTVTSDAPLLKTEGADVSLNYNLEQMNTMPLEFDNRLRNPYLFATLVPGVTLATSTSGTDDFRSDLRINGAPGSTYGVRVDGQNSDDVGNQATNERNLPAVESIQEVSVQSSNFAAEFGQVIGGLVNVTTRSGTNRYHGSAYDSLKNEALNAGIAFTNSGKNHQHTNPRTRQQNFGFSLGGPVFIPKVYHGKDRTFFFFNYEKFDQNDTYASSFEDVPLAAFRNGDFSSLTALTGNKVLATDPLGRPIVQNTIYDPRSYSLAPNGQTVANAFPGNIIPMSRFDPVALKLQALFPQPTVTTTGVNNFAIVYPNWRYFDTTNLKFDHNFSAKQHASFLWTFYRYTSFSHAVGDGLPDPLSSRREGYQRVHTYRLGDNYSLTPTLLFSMAVGDVHSYTPDASPAAELNYNAAANLGFTGGAGLGMPAVSGLAGSLGGMQNFGVTTAGIRWQETPTVNMSATWVHNDHTYKSGVEWKKQLQYSYNPVGASGNLTFGAGPTGLPSTNGQNLAGGSVGYGYASFLLGDVTSATVIEPSSPNIRKYSYGIFAQDTWKVTRNLTLDYGLRWDYQQPPNYEFDRTSEFSPTTPNPSAGNLPGATIFEGYGPGRCNCNFYSTYLYAFAPRLGVAWNFLPKTVLRGGWGLVYGGTPSIGQGTGRTDGIGWNTVNFTNPAFDGTAFQLQQGLQYNPNLLIATNYNAGVDPQPGQLNSPSAMVDRNSGRPPRVSQWNITLQREVMKDLTVEAAWVGNRGAWLQAPGLVNLNAITPQLLAAHGLDWTSPATATLLSSTLSSSTAKNAGFSTPPYAGFPLTSTVEQALRPFPQFSGSLTDGNAPLGSSWYDALQSKVTKRYGHGFQVQGAFTWAKALELTTASNDVFNRPNLKSLAATDIPYLGTIAFQYETPGFGNRIEQLIVHGWTISGIMTYGSGNLIGVPTANNQLSSVLERSTLVNRVAGQPFFLQDPNCGCIDPTKQLVLNPLAWSQPTAGSWGTASPFYDDYRWQHQASEQLSAGRTFHLRERMTLAMRAEFFNAFNRLHLNAPSSGNPLATTTMANGALTGGYGYINTSSLAQQPRSGQITARFEF